MLLDITIFINFQMTDFWNFKQFTLVLVSMAAIALALL